jgi:FtsZ-binding cell division protein ZapB
MSEAVVMPTNSTLAEKVAWYKKYREYIIAVVALLSGVIGGRSKDLYKFRPVSVDTVAAVQSEVDELKETVSKLQTIVLEQNTREESPTTNVVPSQTKEEAKEEYPRDLGSANQFIPATQVQESAPDLPTAEQIRAGLVSTKQLENLEKLQQNQQQPTIRTLK